MNGKERKHLRLVSFENKTVTIRLEGKKRSGEDQTAYYCGILCWVSRRYAHYVAWFGRRLLVGVV